MPDRLGNVVDVFGGALHVLGGAVVRQRLVDVAERASPMRRYPAASAIIRRSRDARRVAFRTGNLGQRLDDQIAGDAQAIGGAGAQIGECGEIHADGIGRFMPTQHCGKREPAQLRFDGLRALGNSSHAAEGNLRFADPAVVDLQAECGEHRRNIFVDALADLVGAKMSTGASFGTKSRRTNSPGWRSCLP